MKKILLTMACAGAMMVSAFAQLLDEKNVTITMDLQPVLQLNLQGPDQFDFTFDEINEYYSGITKYGANILKVSSSVSFDLWAVGLSQTTNFLWDEVINYQTTAGTSSLDEIPITALELRQFPANPGIAGGSTCNGVGILTTDDDYSEAFAPYSITGNSISSGNNCIYTTSNATPYLAPTKAADPAAEKYIAGADGTQGGCSVAGGSYLLETLTSGVPTASGYYFVMDYRILPGLPAQFPASNNANQENSSAPGNSSADGATSLDDGAAFYAAPGVYTMFVKYILVEDQ